METMKTPHIPNSLLPKPRKVTLHEGLFSFAGDLRIHAADEFQKEKTRLIDTLSRFGIAAHAEGTQEATITILRQNALPPEAFAIEVAPESIRLEAADRAGAQYGCIAIGQLAALATMTGSANPVCECCRIEDAPEFCWRGLMLDSARHFQSMETVRQVIKMMGVWRLRILHLHLCGLGVTQKIPERRTHQLRLIPVAAGSRHIVPHQVGMPHIDCRHLHFLYHITVLASPQCHLGNGLRCRARSALPPWCL